MRRARHILALAVILGLALATALTAQATGQVSATGGPPLTASSQDPAAQACLEEQAPETGEPEVVDPAATEDCETEEPPPDSGGEDTGGGIDQDADPDLDPEPDPGPDPEPEPDPDEDPEPDYPDYEDRGDRGGSRGGHGRGGPGGGRSSGGNAGGGRSGFGGPNGDGGRMLNRNGSPSRSNPSRVDVPAPSRGGFGALPSPTTAPVPNAVIEKFQVPIFLLPIYQAAGTQYGVRWEVLAAINEIETDYGRNLAVSSAGALGWMQFLPSTWRQYGVDANQDGKRDPWNPVDAIFAAARYLKAAGYGRNVRRAIFAYNHADWYVDSVLMRARVIAGIPGDLTGSLTGLTEGQFPVYAKARYADDITEQAQLMRERRASSATLVEESDVERRGIEIYTREGAPVVAANDGQITDIGRDSMGRYVTLQDVYGNRYTYRGLGQVAQSYPVPRGVAGADAGLAPVSALPPNAAASGDHAPVRADQGTDPSTGHAGVEKERLFAHPERPNSYAAGGREQLPAVGGGRDAAGFDELGHGEMGRIGKGFTIYRQGDARPLRLKAKNTRALPLKEGARVVQGTILGRVGRPEPNKAAHLYFEIRPVGKGAPLIDPKPILDGWKLLEETAIYRAQGQNVLQQGSSIGQLLLLSKPLLERRVLADTRIEIYPCGRRDIRTGQIDRRVLITMAYLAESGLSPTVTSLKCGHSVYTASGNVSNHASGNAVDIAQLNGIPVLGHQNRGGIVEQAVRRLLLLQGTMRPDELISLFNFGGPSFDLPDHADHIHVGFTPLYGNNSELGKQTLKVLRPKQWGRLIDRLGEINQPEVRQGPKRYTLPARKRASDAHQGE